MATSIADDAGCWTWPEEVVARLRWQQGAGGALVPVPAPLPVMPDPAVAADQRTPQEIDEDYYACMVAF